MSDPNDDPDALKTKPVKKSGETPDPFAFDDLDAPAGDDFPDFASSSSDDALAFGEGGDLPSFDDPLSSGSLDDFGSLDDLAMPGAEVASGEGLDPFADEPLPVVAQTVEPESEGDAFAGFSMSDQAEPEVTPQVEEPLVAAETDAFTLEDPEPGEPTLAALADDGDPLALDAGETLGGSDAFALDEPSDDFAMAAELGEPAEFDMGAGLVLDEAAEELPLSALPDTGAAWPEDEEEEAFMASGDDVSDEPRPPRVRKYMFDTSFDPIVTPVDLPVLDAEEEVEILPEEPDPEPEPPPPPPPPTFSEAELAEACEHARAAGEAAGIATTQASINAQFAVAAQAIGGVLPGLMSDRDLAVQHLSEEAARLAVALVAKALPELNRRYGVGEIEAIVKSSVALAVDQPRIIIRVAPDLASGLSREFETLAQATGYQGRIIVLGDAAMGPADVRIDWGDGGAERLAHKVWGELAAIVERAVGHLEQIAPVAERPAADDIGSAA